MANRKPSVYKEILITASSPGAVKVSKMNSKAGYPILHKALLEDANKSVTSEGYKLEHEDYQKCVRVQKAHVVPNSWIGYFYTQNKSQLLQETLHFKSETTQLLHPHQNQTVEIEVPTSKEHLIVVR